MSRHTYRIVIEWHAVAAKFDTSEDYVCETDTQAWNYAREKIRKRVFARVKSVEFLR